MITGERLNNPPVTSKRRPGCLQSSFLFSLVLECVVIAIRHKKEIKGTQFGKKGIKLSPFTDAKIMQKIPKTTKKLLEL